NGSNNPGGIQFFPTNCNVSTLYPTSSYSTPQLHHSYGSFSSDTNEILNETNNNNNTDSIAHLRIKAKEYMSAIIGTTNHGSIDNADGTDDEHDGDDEDAVVIFRDVTGKLDIGKSGLIFNVFASAFSCRRHLARRF
ncbi:unnamed protein product, partial [Rotaria sp. Silwood2]